MIVGGEIFFIDLSLLGLILVMNLHFCTEIYLYPVLYEKLLSSFVFLLNLFQFI